MLAEIHKHINDSRISFDEAEHNYFIDGQKAKFSVTEIIDKFFPEFDSAYWAERKAIEKLNQDHVEYDSRCYKQQSNKYWKMGERESTQHQKEPYYTRRLKIFIMKNITNDYPPEFDFFKNFHNKYKSFNPIERSGEFLMTAFH